MIQVNFRILPGDSVSSVISHLKSNIDKDIEIKVLDGSEPSPITDDLKDPFQILQYTIHQLFPDVVVAPGLGVGLTDTRHYFNLSQNIFRFIPSRINKSDLPRIHGLDERISVDNYHDIVNFYFIFIQNSDKMLLV